MEKCRMFFFFKQKTAYEMRISDWSSDVCSSDLAFALDADLCLAFARSKPQFGTGKKPVDDHIAADDAVIDQLGGSGVAHDEQRRHVGALHAFSKFDEDLRSEERRVGKECVSTCRSRW